MDLNNLPGSSSRFSTSSFASHLSSATKYTNIRGSKDSILKVVRNSAGAIRAGKFDSREALHKIQSLDKGMSLEQKHNVQKLLRHLEAKPGVAAAGGSASEAKVKVNPYLMQRDTGNTLSYSGLSGDLSGRANRGQEVRNKMNMEHAKSLGSGEAARDIQKKMFENTNRAA